MEIHIQEYKGRIVAMLCLLLLPLGCFALAETGTSAAPATTPASTPVITVEPTASPVPTPTATPSPTPTPSPNPTPVPTPTPTPTPLPDTESPVIEGAKDITVTLGDSISYRKGITVTDDSGEDITLEIDKSAVNPDQAGIYPVIYSATDSAGNVTNIEIILTIQEPAPVSEEYVNQLADQLIAEQTTPEMSLWDKAYTLWNWCRKNIRYSYSSGDRSSVYAGAYEGLNNRQGDCYAYYATYSVLLTRLGVENICVARVGGTSNHWWNLVNLGDGWYHCDCSPRAKNHLYKCFMQTDAQLQEYTDFYTEHPAYYNFDPTLYPDRETTIIFDGNPTGVRE